MCLLSEAACHLLALPPLNLGSSHREIRVGHSGGLPRGGEAWKSVSDEAVTSEVRCHLWGLPLPARDHINSTSSLKPPALCTAMNGLRKDSVVPAAAGGGSGPCEGLVDVFSQGNLLSCVTRGHLSRLAGAQEHRDGRNRGLSRGPGSRREQVGGGWVEGQAGLRALNARQGCVLCGWQ